MKRPDVWGAIAMHVIARDPPLTMSTIRRFERLNNDPTWIQAHGYGYAVGGGSEEDQQATVNAIFWGWFPL